MRFTAIVFGLVLCACSTSNSNPGESTPIGTMSIAAGDGQLALDDSFAPIRPAVKIVDADGQPVTGVVVTFTVAPGSGGEVTGASATTGADGVAVVGSWRLYGLPGTSTLLATAANVANSPVTFTATSISLIAVSAAATSNHQTATAGTAVVFPPEVDVISRDPGDALDGTPVVFKVVAGGGQITGASTTLVRGSATVGSWTLGPTPGLNQLRAIVTRPIGTDSVTFTATGQ